MKNKGTWIMLLVLALGMLACCGVRDIGSMERSYGDKAMKTGILVVYGSWAGSTAEVADFIGRTLAEGGARVEVKPVESVKSLSGYHAVLIGSAIRIGKVKPEIMAFVKRNSAELRQIPTVFFVVCMTMKDDTPENRKTVHAYLDPLREHVNPVDTGLFAGRMDYAKLGFFARIAVERFVKVPEGDFRDWNAIRAWAQKLSPKLDVQNALK